MDAVRSSETSVEVYRTTRRHIPEDSTVLSSPVIKYRLSFVFFSVLAILDRQFRWADYK
jgi:hypothetical protein